MEQKLSTRIIIWLGFVLTLGNAILCVVRYVFATVNVEEKIVTTNPIYLIIAMTLPLIWWGYSTRDDNWNYYDRKKATLTLVIINFILVMMQPLWTLLFDVLVVRICTIPVGRNFTEDMIFNLCRITLAGICFAVGYAIAKGLQKALTTEEMRETIEGFRYQHIIDTRSNKENLYDLLVLNDMKTGKMVPIKENERFTHISTIGSSGSGKTSSTASPMIRCDMDKKVANGKKRQAALLQMIRQGKAYVELPTKTDQQFLDDIEKDHGFVNDMEAECLIVAKEGYEDELKEIRKKYPDCGMTIMAPNNGFPKDMVKLAKARNLKVNVIDPAETYKDENVRQLGINPFFVELDLPYEERIIQISNKASTFSQVLLAVNEINGTGDTYFRDINTSVTTNIAMCCMLHANLNRRQTSITEIQQCINEFHELEYRVDEIQDHLHTYVVVQSTAKKKENIGKFAQKADMADEGSESTTKEAKQFREVVSMEEIPPQLVEKGMTIEKYNEQLREEGDAYYETIHFVKQELLGDGSEKMFDQARGLRNLINKLLLDPRIKKVLSAKDKDFIDWDKALARNEITVINTANEFSKESSTALGLFIMLNLTVSIFRRPMATRTNHFITIDEASQYMHPMYEDMFALFRQYRVSTHLMMQSLSQMDKNETTKYLKGVLLGAGTHIVFGRTGTDEMKYYEQLSGMKTKIEEQTSYSSNSEFDNDYKISGSTRQTSQRVAQLEGSEIRVRDFQEVTVYMTDQGRVRPGFVAKMHFLRKSDSVDRHIRYVNWAKYFPKNWDRKLNIAEVETSKVRERSIQMVEAATKDFEIENYKSDERTGFDTLPNFETEEEMNIQKMLEQRSEKDQRDKEALERRKRLEELDRNAEKELPNKVQKTTTKKPRKKPAIKQETEEDEDINLGGILSEEESSEEFSQVIETQENPDEDEMKRRLEMLNRRKVKET